MTRAVERLDLASSGPDPEDARTGYAIDTEATGYVAAIQADVAEAQAPAQEVEPLHDFSHLFPAHLLGSPSVLQDGKYVLGVGYKHQLAQTAEGAETLTQLLDEDDPWKDYALAQLSDYWTEQHDSEHAFAIASSIHDTTLQLYALSRLEQRNDDEELEKKLLQKINDDTTKVLSDYKVEVGQDGPQNVSNLDNVSLRALDLATGIIGANGLHQAVEAEEEKYNSDNEKVQEAAFQLEMARIARAGIINNTTKKAA